MLPLPLTMLLWTLSHLLSFSFLAPAKVPLPETPQCFSWVAGAHTELTTLHPGLSAPMPEALPSHPVLHKHYQPQGTRLQWVAGSSRQHAGSP